MKRSCIALVALAIAAGSAGPTVAQENGATVESKSDEVSSQKAEKTTARATVMINSYKSDSTLKKLRKKGIDQVRRFNVGVYCIKPTSTSKIKANKSVASVTVNWISSYGNNLLATIAAPSNSCTQDEFEVRTFTFTPPAGYVASDDVSFTLVVP